MGAIVCGQPPESRFFPASWKADGVNLAAPGGVTDIITLELQSSARHEDNGLHGGGVAPASSRGSWPARCERPTTECPSHGIHAAYNRCRGTLAPTPASQ